VEFKTMVRALHAAGMEVILDVVYNHTAEGNQMGPTIGFRGIDNLAYYRTPQDQRYYEDFTGCGNTLNLRHPRVLQMLMDSLRYWVLEMHVDGFRFDLASALARELHAVDKLSSFFDVIHQDPVLSQVKLIAEPWDIGDGGYQVGNFPVGWAEWNGKYRDSVRRFWRGDGGTVSDFATRLCGSSDLYGQTGRRPYASVNFITAHDGFTLQDLVSYDQKHNEANGDENRDGDNNNSSWNSGAEGPTDNGEIQAIRERRKRDLIASLFLSQGVPMLRGGDELSQSQNGNNNAFCQDNETSWLKWDISGKEKEFLEFTKKIVAIWASQPVLKRRKFFHGREIRGSNVKDVTWHEPSGKEMTDENWKKDFVRSLGMCLDGEAIEDRDEKGEPIKGPTLYILLNGHHEDVPANLPAFKRGKEWMKLVDTFGAKTEPTSLAFGSSYLLRGRSIAIFQLK
jgi:isoamylase